MQPERNDPGCRPYREMYEDVVVVVQWFGARYDMI